MKTRQLKTGRGSQLLKRLNVCNMPEKIHNAEHNYTAVPVLYIYIVSSCVDIQPKSIRTKSRCMYFRLECTYYRNIFFVILSGSRYPCTVDMSVAEKAYYQ
jgi:hypothetical protein